MDYIVGGNCFHGVAGFAPSQQTSDDYERAEASFPQQVHHTGASGFARSSTVKVNVLILGKQLDLFGKPVRLKTDGPLNAGGAAVVVTVAANIHQ